MQTVLEKIYEELTYNLEGVSIEELESLTAEIRSTKGKNNIFVYGRGREMMAISAFAVRLNQMGYRAYIVGECHVPPILRDDLFLVTNGRNMLQAHAAQMRIAREQNARILVLTAHPDGGFSSIPVDGLVHMNGQTLDDEIEGTAFYQTMGTAYEQALLVLLDCVVVNLMEQDGLEPEILQNNYTNLC